MLKIHVARLWLQLRWWHSMLQSVLCLFEPVKKVQNNKKYLYVTATEGVWANDAFTLKSGPHPQCHSRSVMIYDSVIFQLIKLLPCCQEIDIVTRDKSLIME